MREFVLGHLPSSSRSLMEPTPVATESQLPGYTVNTVGPRCPALHAATPPSGRFAEVGFAHLRIREQGLGLAAQRDQPRVHYIRPVRGFEREACILLDQQHRYLACRHGAYHLENLLDHDR